LAGLSLLPATLCAKAQASQVFLSAFSDQRGQHFVGMLNQAGSLSRYFAVPSRGHSACLSPDGSSAIFFARRPRRWLIALDVRSGKLVAQVESNQDRHFFGHGVFSQDGTLLYASENDYQNNRGVIGIYDVKNNYTRIGELPSFGIGPHELGLLSDGKTLVVANGGIETHPDYGRLKLNIDTMSPSLTYIDLLSAQEIISLKPPHHQLSLRHLAINQDDVVIVGAQHQGRSKDNLPLVFMAGGLGRAGSVGRQGHASRENAVLDVSKKGLQPMLGQPLAIRKGLDQYVASVAFSQNGKYALTSSPRGDSVSVWDAIEGRWLYEVSLPDIGGISAYGADMLLSSGNGTLYVLSLDFGTVAVLQQHTSRQWDNHLKG
jgi:hypothetical protein